jgi:malate synthase
MRVTREETLGLLAVADAPIVGMIAFEHAAPAAPAAHPTTAAAVTRAGFLEQIDSCVRHLAAWLGSTTAGQAAADTAPDLLAAEPARIQIWRWLHCADAALDDGTRIDFALFDAAIQRVGERLPRRGPGQGNVLRAAWLLAELSHAAILPESVSVPAPRGI